MPMARVHLSGELRRLAGDRHMIEVEARTVSEVVARLASDFPELGLRIGDGMTVALDGELIPNADFHPVDSDTDVHFVPSIGGG
jgi:molybdopterin converting factor small subunit